MPTWVVSTISPKALCPKAKPFKLNKLHLVPIRALEITSLPRSQQDLAVSDLGELDFLGRGEQDGDVVPDDADEERDGHDGQEHPQTDGRI